MEERFLGYVIDKIENRDVSKGNHAIIQLVAIRDSKGKYEKLDTKQKEEYCPPEGKIFCPGFFADFNSNFNNCPFVEFSIILGNKKGNDSLKNPEFIINYRTTPKGVNLPRLLPYKGKLKKIVENGYLSPKELNETIDKQNVFKGENVSFFLYDEVQNLALGKFTYDVSSKEITSAYGKEVQNFTLESDLVVSDSKNLLYALIRENYNNLSRGSLIDFMTDQQLSDWFSKKFGDVVGVNKQSVTVICDFPETQSQENILDSIRFKRIKSKTEAYNLDSNELVELVCTHKDYFSQFTDKIDIIGQEVEKRITKEFLDNAPETICRNKEEIDLQKKEISEQQDKINKLKGEYKSKLKISQGRIRKETEKLETKIDEKQKQLDSLKRNYDAVLATLSAGLSLFDMTSKDNKVQSGNTISDFGILTPVVFPAEGSSYKELQEKNDEAKKSLLLRNVGIKDGDILKQIPTTIYILNYKACFIPCVSWGFVFAKAIRNVEVYIIHVEYNWLHYEDYCKHGLLEPFKAAHTNSLRNYILILDGLNITQPECGLRPLLNVISGTEPLLQDYAVPFPKNLTIFATVLSSSGDNPLGLKLKTEYFSGWGAFGSPVDFIPLQDGFIDLKTVNCGFFESSDLQLPKESICKPEELKVYFEY
jgi:hypothetical protein